MKPTREQIELAAAAIANERGGRRGMPQITNVLDLLPGTLREEVVEDATAALAAVGLGELCEALAESVKLQSHYAELLNMHDGGQRITFRSEREWMARLRQVREHKQ